MAWDVAIVQAAAPTTGTTLDFTKTGFGTPKFAMFFATKATVNGTMAAHRAISQGYTDGTRHRVQACRSRDGIGTASAISQSATDEVVMILDSVSNAVEGEANFDSWITDGVRIDFTVNPVSSAYLITCVMFTGSDVSAYVGDFNHTGAVNTTIDITDPGFQPDAIIFFGKSAQVWSADSSESEFRSHVGFSVRNSPIDEGCMVSTAKDRVNTSQAESSVSNSRFYQMIPTTFSIYVVNSYLSNGFRVKKTFDATDGYAAYAALKFNGAANFWAGGIDGPSATGNKSWTEPGFTPKFVMILSAYMSTYNVNDGGEGGGAMGISMFTGSEEYSVSGRTNDNETTTKESSMTDSKAMHTIHPINFTGPGEFIATFSSFDANGWTLNFSESDSNVKKWVALALGDVALGDDVLASVADNRQVVPDRPLVEAVNY